MRSITSSIQTSRNREIGSWSNHTVSIWSRRWLDLLLERPDSNRYDTSPKNADLPISLLPIVLVIKKTIDCYKENNPLWTFQVDSYCLSFLSFLSSYSSTQSERGLSWTCFSNRPRPNLLNISNVLQEDPGQGFILITPRIFYILEMNLKNHFNLLWWVGSDPMMVKVLQDRWLLLVLVISDHPLSNIPCCREEKRTLIEHKMMISRIRFRLFSIQQNH
jgi:hypothetical protein